MISKISFSKLTRSELHRLTWLTAVQFVAFALLIPFRVLVMLAMGHNEGSFFRMADADTIDFFNRNVGLGHLENTLFILAAGVLCALCAFHYIHSAVQLDLMHSLSVRRERLFGATMLGSVLTFVIAYGASQFLAMVVGAFNGALTARATFEIGLASVEGLLFFLCSYAATLLMMMLTGKILTSVLAVGVFAGYVPLLWAIWIMLREMFFTTALNGYYSTGSDALFYSSPWMICLAAPLLRGEMIEGVTGFLPDIGELCQLLALAAVMTAGALLLYRVRRTEAAGSALAFRRTEGVIKLLLTVPTSLVAAVVAYAIFDSVVWVIAFVLIFGALGCMIMEFIYRWDIRQVFAHKVHIVITVAATLVIFLCLRYDVTGYNTYLPEPDELEAVSVTRNLDWNYNKFHANSTEEILDFLETDHIEPVYELAKDGGAHCNINTYTGEVSYISIKYREKNGRETYRSYWVDKDLCYRKMDELLEDPDYRSRFYPIMSWDGSTQLFSLECELSDRILNAWGLPDDWKVDENVELVYSYGPGVQEDGLEYSEGYTVAKEATRFRFRLPVSRAQEVIEAYCKDLEQVPFSELAETQSSLMIEEEDWDLERYGISEKCENVLGVLKEIIVD